MSEQLRRKQRKKRNESETSVVHNLFEMCDGSVPYFALPQDTKITKVSRKGSSSITGLKPNTRYAAHVRVCLPPPLEQFTSSVAGNMNDEECKNSVVKGPFSHWVFFNTLQE